MTRRSLLLQSLAFGLASAADPVRKDHFPFGPLNSPRPIPPWKVKTHAGVETDLASVVRGHVTALQLMFTSCSAICPIQGSVFARAQQALGKVIPDAQFISLSIDPQTDSASEMTAWLKKFKSHAGWWGITPRAGDVDEIFKVLGEGGMPRPQGSDPHTSQVYLIDRAGRLVFRTPSMPQSKDVVEALKLVAALR